MFFHFYFTDSGIIGSKAFVAAHYQRYQRFQHLFACKNVTVQRNLKKCMEVYGVKTLNCER
jgi:hypothetical protein